MSAKAIINKIPVSKINEIIEQNIIANALPNQSNAYMMYLIVIWRNYIAPGQEVDIGCSFCLNNILNNFTGMKDLILEVYKENKSVEEI